jgi:glutamate/tyrosine decarboxylase-like PLP-dependent enzyme
VLPERRELEEALDVVTRAARAYLDGICDRLVRGDPDALSALDSDLPDEGEGAAAALDHLVAKASEAAVQSAGPRFFHFVMGGVTPAALAAEWFTSTLDQNVGLWLSSPMAARLETLVLSWLRALFALPAAWGGVLTTGATMANFVGLAAARHWCAERRGVVVEDAGLFGLEPIEIFSSGYIHASALKAAAMLGMGRDHVHSLVGDDAGGVDLDALERDLARAGAPAIVVANAGEVNAGSFDPIEDMAEIAERHGAWLHVDGAFGLFARVAPRSAELARGVERARSVAADAHKWLNVPYDSGFAFVSDPELLARTFGMTAAYFATGDGGRPDFGFQGPESSRRARALPIYATLRAYGRSGYRELVERHLELAQRVARRVDEADDLERLAECRLNIVSFRLRPRHVPEERLDELNRRAGELVIEDGRVYVGTTTYRGRVAFRPAVVNWRTSETDVDLLVDVVRECGHRARAEMGA